MQAESYEVIADWRVTAPELVLLGPVDHPPPPIKLLPTGSRRPLTRSGDQATASFFGCATTLSNRSTNESTVNP